LAGATGIWGAAWAQVLVLFALGGAVYLAALALFRVEDMPALAAAARRFLRRSPQPSEEARP